MATDPAMPSTLASPVPSFKSTLPQNSGTVIAHVPSSTETLPLIPATNSAIQRAVKVLPVPQAMTCFPRSPFSNPCSTASNATCWCGRREYGSGRTASASGAWCERSGRRIGEMQHLAGGLNVLDCLLDDVAPFRTGVDNQPGHEGLSSRRCHEGLDMRFLDPRARCVTRALDGTAPAFAFRRHQVDTGVLCVESGLFAGPLAAWPNFRESARA